jgi:hypothetical protein
MDDVVVGHHQIRRPDHPGATVAISITNRDDYRSEPVHRFRDVALQIG